jgi:adenine phosphoribosyltransferase
MAKYLPHYLPPMTPAQLSRLQQALRDVPDFPKPGILFKDITPIISDGDLFRLSVEAIAETLRGQKIDKIAAIDARGFIFAGALATRLGVGMAPVRKKGKLPWNTISVSYDLEYGSNVLEMHEDAILPGEQVWLIDDVLATGGTAGAAVEIIQKLGGKLLGMTFLLELAFLEGRKRFPADLPIHSVLSY